MTRSNSIIDTNAVFLESVSNRYTYGDLYRYAARFKQFLADNNIERNDKVALHGSSTDEFVLTIASCWLLGIPFIPFSYTITGDEIREYIDRLHPAILLSDQNKKSITTDPEVPVHEFPKIEPGGPAGQPPVPDGIIGDDSVFGYFFTSGTTSRPKIVPLKRRQMLHAAWAGALNFKPDKNGLWLLCLPVNHVGGTSAILRSLLYGTGIYRLERFSTNVALDLFKNHKTLQVASLVPTMLTRLLDNPEFDLHSRFKAILLGGGAVPQKLQNRVNKKNLPVVYSYGMTETCAQIAAVPLPEREEVPANSAGRVLEGTQIEIRDEDGNKLEPGQEGVIWLKGPQVFDGYLDSTEVVFDNNQWFCTGDIGRIDADRYLYISSRRSDLIVTGGENVSPFEVEEALNALPFIREAAVFGESDPEWGQVVTAVIVSSGKQASIDDIRQLLSERLAKFKLPKKVIYVENLPHTESGKIKRDGLLVWARKNSRL